MLYLPVQRLFYSAVFLICASISTYAQPSYTISGYVRDASSGESIANATVRVANEVATVSNTNTYGFYSLTLRAGTYELHISHIGHQEKKQAIQLSGNLTLNIELTSGQAIEEVVVTQRSARANITNPQMGVANLSVQEIKKVPVIMGEQDVLKTIQLLPGVMSGGEGSSNFFVRGGSGDHNLILLDEAMVYNASHLFGFFSTFNSDAIKDVNLYKGGMPAQYGGRLASVLDINMLEGNNKQYGVEGGIGLIASRLKFDGPIVKDKGSFMLSGRRTYADMFLKLSNNEDINQSRMYFYDLNLKANYEINDQNRIFLSGYFGKDLLGYSDLFDFDWGNATTSLRWNSVVSNRLFSNTTLVFSDFNYNVNVNSDGGARFTIASVIRNFNVKQNFQYSIGSGNTLRFGVNALRQRVAPASLLANEASSINTLQIPDRTGAELAGYVSHDWKATEKLNLEYGLRLNSFLLFGPTTLHTFDAQGDLAGEEENHGGVAHHYINLEPRLSLSYQLLGHNSIKASYNRNTQNLHQLSNSTASLPTDTWVMSSNNVRPQIADQVAVGYYHNFRNNTYEFSAEAYYKDMQNQIDYRNGADLQANEYIEGELLYGVGRAYGLELYMKKRVGDLTGWISYALSRSERQFDDINDGHWFAARQDRTHDFSAVAMYELNDRWNISATMVYSTGNAVTFPSGKYVVDGQTVWYYTERNGYRMPDYHRLDLGVTREGNPNKRFQSSWTFGVYNAYNRKNAFTIDFRENDVNPNVSEAYRIALFGIIPSVTWNFKF